MNSIKSFRYPGYNWDRDLVTGEFIRYGKTFEEDPLFSPVGPEILDLEISKSCRGIDGYMCGYCYKSNFSGGKVMSFDTFKTIFEKVKGNLSQIAFGIGDIDSNHDMWKMFEYCRERDVMPNITINGDRMKAVYYERLAELCGTVCVSNHYTPVSFNAVQSLIKNGLRQVSIQQMVSSETISDCYTLINRCSSESRLNNLYSIIFLKLKQKGRGQDYNHLLDSEYELLFKHAFNSCANIGFDTCFAPEIEKYLKSIDQYDSTKDTIERCESSLFSAYINVLGDYCNCSFQEGNPDWKKLNVLECDDFVEEIWLGENVSRFRTNLLNNQRICPLY